MSLLDTETNDKKILIYNYEQMTLIYSNGLTNEKQPQRYICLCKFVLITFEHLLHLLWKQESLSLATMKKSS